MVGESRTRRGFLWFPKTIGGLTFWLERAEWEEVLTSGRGGIIYWHETRWMTNLIDVPIRLDLLPKSEPLNNIRFASDRPAAYRRPFTESQIDALCRNVCKFMSASGMPADMAIAALSIPQPSLPTISISKEPPMGFKTENAPNPDGIAPALEAAAEAVKDEMRLTVQIDKPIESVQIDAVVERPDVAEPPITIAPDRLADLERFHLPENHAFRSMYRSLKPEEAALSRAIKDQAFQLLRLIEMTPVGRDQSLAKTHLEDSVMRAVRAITA
jgi:hypothetical protein